MTLDEAAKYAPLATALIGCLAAVIAAGSAAFAGVQMRLARRNAVLQALQTFDKGANDREVALKVADTDLDREHAFHELMNFFELYAAICNRRLVTGLAHELIRDRLIDSVVVIERAPAWHDVIDKAIFHSDTFSELRLFMKCNKRIADERRVAAEKRAKLLQTSEATR